MKAAHAGRAAARVREARLESAVTVVELAARERAEFILIAGDTFEDNGVSRAHVEEVVALLDRASCPVYVIPGNHDHLGVGSVWEHAAWPRAANVNVLARREAVEIPGGELYPCPVEERWSANDPTAWIPRETDHGIRIGIAHGTVAGVPESERAHPIARDAAERTGLDYLALGHWHSTSVMGRMAYSGTHEPSRFGERESGQALIVEIDAPGVEPRVRAVSTGKLKWVMREDTLRTAGQLARAVSELETMANPQSILLDWQLRGHLFATDRGALASAEKLPEHFLFARLDTESLATAPTDHRWIDDLPEGYLREVAKRLQARQDELGTHALLALHEML
ncbi:MAG: metallophosphoesterase [Bryobacteraceae bacterium]